MKTYFETRIYDELGITTENNTIRLKGAHNIEYTAPIFSEDKQGNIQIAVYTLDRKAVEYDHPKSTPEKPSIYNDRLLQYYIKRLKEPIVSKDGKLQKYFIPKGAGTYPFLPPSIIEKYEKKEKIKTLILTEGYFKAFKGAMHGLDIIGLSSITHYKNKQTQLMYDDVTRIIKDCSVENVIILYDGDCRNLSSDALQKGDDLYNRPSGFFNSIKNIRELLKDFLLDIYFAHVITDSMPDKPKGLDDLLISFKGKESEVVNDILTFSNSVRFCYKENVKYSLAKLQRYLCINSAQDFYSFHADTIQDGEFTFNGTKYRYEKDKEELIIIRKKEARDYIRVGDFYYELVNIPNKYGQLEKAVHRRLKSTITDDFGRPFITQIDKFKAFFVQPDHINYQKVRYNCYNLYAPFEYLPEDGICRETLIFLRHIFGKQYRLGMDYLQILYQQPTQILPILCLVSEENNTGKTTFVKWLKSIFTSNMAIVGNSDLANDFNVHYVSKLIIACDETFIDKKTVIERVKSLATADKITMNSKGKDQTEVDFFGKFILLSNNEDNFIYADTNDIRYWVVKVPVPEKDNVNLLTDMIAEIPSFLYYLNKRKMKVHERQSRMWFSPASLTTDALSRIVDNSRTSIEKEIRFKVSSLFADFDLEELFLTPKLISEIFFNKRHEESYIAHILSKKLKVKLYRNEIGKEVPKRFKIPYWGEPLNSNDDAELPILYRDCIGRPYVFYRKDFFTVEETIIKNKSEVDDSTINKT